MTIQHSFITDPNIHEPKGITTAAIGDVYSADGTGSGTWGKLTEADTFDFTDKTKNLFGWNDIADSLYTSASPLAVASGVRTKVTNNGAATQTDTSRLGAIWDEVNGHFLIDDLNATYVFKIACKIKTTAVVGTPYTVLFELESANGPTIIAGHTMTIKGGSTVNWTTLTLPIYFGSFINNQDLSLYVIPDAAITLYDIGFVVQRTYKET